MKKYALLFGTLLLTASFSLSVAAKPSHSIVINGEDKTEEYLKNEKLQKKLDQITDYDREILSDHARIHVNTASGDCSQLEVYITRYDSTFDPKDYSKSIRHKSETSNATSVRYCFLSPGGFESLYGYAASISNGEATSIREINIDKKSDKDIPAIEVTDKDIENAKMAALKDRNLLDNYKILEQITQKVIENGKHAIWVSTTYAPVNGSPIEK